MYCQCCRQHISGLLQVALRAATPVQALPALCNKHTLDLLQNHAVSHCLCSRM